LNILSGTILISLVLLSTTMANAAPPCPLVYEVGEEIKLPAGVKAAKRIPPPKLPRRAVGKRAPTGEQKKNCGDIGELQ